MDVMVLSNISANLDKTMSADANERKQAETFIKSMELQPMYSLHLLEIIVSNAASIPTRQAAAVSFKNFVKTYWSTDMDVSDRLQPNDREQIRARILGALLSVSGCLQSQLSEAIGMIWREDFPHKWPNLIPDLVQHMAQRGADLSMVHGVLQTAHTLFKRYRHECAGNDLFREMNTVISQFGAPLTELAANLVALVVGDQRINEGARLVPVFECLLLVCKIFLSLNCQDLPEFFEDNIDKWMTIFRKLLEIDASIVELVSAASHSRGAGGDGTDSTGSLVEQVKSQVCDNMSLYASKYETEFTPYLAGFVTDVWEMLINTSNNAKYDMLIGNAIGFLCSVINRPQHRHLFENPETLQKLCEKVILPNMHFRSADEELFTENPEEYLRLDMEGSDTHSRRRAACRLVHVLCQAFEGPVITNFSTYIEHLLAEYSGSLNGSAWMSKDAALLLVTTVATRGKTEQLGVTVSTGLVNITTFYETHVLPELKQPNVDHLPVIKADCIRYAIAFRGLLSPVAIGELVSLAPILLTASSPVVHSYAAAMVDKLLSLRHPDNGSEPLITKESVPDPNLLIDRLLAITVHREHMENMHAMRALARVCCCLQERCLPSMNALVSTLLQILNQVVKNPSKPTFNHFLLETICICIRTTCSADPSSVALFESALFPVFQEILQNDISEFVPYVFQLISVMLEQYSLTDSVAATCKASNLGTLSNFNPQRSRPSPPYAALLPRLLVPSLWDHRGNVPALSRLIHSYILYHVDEVLSSNKLSAILGIYQRLIGSTAFETQAFTILGALILATPKDVLQPYLRQVFIVIFRRLQASKTEKFMRAFVWFIARFILVYSSTELLQLIDGTQANLFGRVLEKVLLPYADSAICMPFVVPGFGAAKGHINVTSARIQWHQVSVGLIRLLSATDSVFAANGPYTDCWVPLIQQIVNGLAAGPGRGGDSAVNAAVAFLSQNADASKGGLFSSEERFVEVDTDTSSSQASFGQLTFATQRIPELCSEITDPRIYLAKILFQIASAQPGQVGPMLQSKLDGNAASYLQSCFNLAGLTLP